MRAKSGFSSGPGPVAIALLVGSSTGFAFQNPVPDSLRESESLIEALSGYDPNGTELMERLRLKLGAWVDAGYTHNFDDPRNRQNLPVTFNSWTRRFLFNQFNLYLERAIKPADRWDFGFRFDVMVGSDSQFTQALGLEISDAGRQKIVGDTDHPNHNLTRLAFPQIYGEIYMPYLGGVTLKGGHFYTLIGYEVVTAPDNFFYSHAYTMQYGEPFTHTGVLLSFNLPLPNLSMTVGAVNGWDSFSSDIDDAWNFIGGLSWSNGVEGAGALSVSLSAIHGTVAGYHGKMDHLTRSLYSLVVSYDLTEKLHLVLQHDHGWEEQLGDENDAHWYGLNGYLTYDLNRIFSLGARMEWFRDDEGIRVVGDGEPASFYEMTFGANIKPTNWINIRPEIRYDWAEGNVQPYDDRSQDDQLLFAVDLVVNLL